MTSHLTRSYGAENPNISRKMRTIGNSFDSTKTVRHFTLKFLALLILIKFETLLQGESAYVCWAYSCATMIRTECRRLINHLFINGKINEETKNWNLNNIDLELTHKEIRNLLMFVLLPKRLHFDGAHQAAFLRAAVSRVNNSHFFNLLKTNILF